MTHPTDDEIICIAMKHGLQRCEERERKAVIPFARALLAEQARTEPDATPMNFARLKFFRDLNSAERIKVLRVFMDLDGIPDDQIDTHGVQTMLFKNVFATTQPLKAEQAKDAAEDAELLDWLEEKHYALHPIKEDQGDDTYTLWWQVTDKDKSISGHPLGNIRVAIRAARAAERKA